MTSKTMTGYPSIDKPWLKYYSEETIVMASRMARRSYKRQKKLGQPGAEVKTKGYAPENFFATNKDSAKSKQGSKSNKEDSTKRAFGG